MERKKAFIIPFPQHGHINPMLSMTRELVQNHNFDVTFYGLEDRREAIQSTGATYREFKHFNLNKYLNNMPDIIDIFKYQIKVSHQELPCLFEDCIREQPDVIIYDFMSLHGKFLLNLVRRKKCLKRPIGVCFTPTFAIKPGVFPTNEEWTELMGINFWSIFRFIWLFILQVMGINFWSIFRFIWLFILQVMLSAKFRFNIWNTMKFFAKTDDLNLIGISPEFQPKREFFGEELIFVGHSASDTMRKTQVVRDEKLREFLDSTDVLNPSFNPGRKKEKILIFASLGTVFNDFKLVFDKILEAFRLFESENSSVESRLVMSVGHKVFEQFKNFKSQKNIMITPHVPQINVLEKASLFITHCGMSSTNEAIHFAVPVICIPMAADQPFVAKRLCDDLNLGLRLEPFEFTPCQLKESMVKVLNDQCYHQRMLEFSKILNKYNGGQIAAEEINGFLTEKWKK